MPGILEEQRKIVVERMLWAITEGLTVDKFKTHLKSKEAHQRWREHRYAPRCQLRHDHVYQRKIMLKALMHLGGDPSAGPRIESILANAVGCTITKHEHDVLLAREERLDGWDRYKAASIIVFDTSTIMGEEWPLP
jgi:hypothetical protein